MIVVTCLSGTGLWAYLRTGSTPSVPEPSSLTVTPEVVEVKRSDSDTALASVELRNTSSRPIHIDKLETSCHCTSVDAIEHMDLAPGQATTLKLKLQLPGFGKQEAFVTIHSDSPTNPKIRIPVKMHGAKILPPYFLTNSQEVRHQITAPDDRRVEFEISAVESPGTPWMTGFDSNNEAFSVVSCESTITTKYDETSLHRTYVCVLEASRFAPGETLRGSLRPRCRTESMKPVPLIPVTFSSEATAKAVPAQLFVTQKSRQSLPVSKTVLIETAANLANPVREVTASVDWIQIERIRGAETHPAYRVTVNPPAKLPSDLVPQISFHFLEASIPTLNVPLVFE